MQKFSDNLLRNSYNAFTAFSKSVFLTEVLFPRSPSRDSLLNLEQLMRDS